ADAARSAARLAVRPAGHPRRRPPLDLVHTCWLRQYGSSGGRRRSIIAAVAWTALTRPDQTPEFLYGLAVDSTWNPGAPIGFRCDEDVQVSGRVLCVQRNERLSYVIQSAPTDPPVYLTWLIRPGSGGCTIRLQIDEIDTADSLQDAEDIWLPVLEALQQLVNPGQA